MEIHFNVKRLFLQICIPRSKKTARGDILGLFSTSITVRISNYSVDSSIRFFFPPPKSPAKVNTAAQNTSTDEGRSSVFGRSDTGCGTGSTGRGVELLSGTGVTIGPLVGLLDDVWLELPLLLPPPPLGRLGVG